jgi:hypothetical protein
MLGIAVPPGSSEVEIEFHQPYLGVGALLSVFGLATGIGLMITVGRSDRPARD